MSVIVDAIPSANADLNNITTTNNNSIVVESNVNLNEISDKFGSENETEETTSLTMKNVDYNSTSTPNEIVNTKVKNG